MGCPWGLGGRFERWGSVVMSALAGLSFVATVVALGVVIYAAHHRAWQIAVYAAFAALVNVTSFALQAGS